MAQFEPGHLHIERHALNKADHSYNLCIDYETVQTPTEGKSVAFRVHGTIEDKPVDESFAVNKDNWYNFAASVDKIVEKHGLPVRGIVTSVHKTFYDDMFKDIEKRLGVHAGDPINPESLG